MTYHIHCKNYECSKCSVSYIPFKKGFVCPKCGELTDEFYDLIPKIIISMKGNKRREGSYTPPVWAYLNFSDEVQFPIFGLFDCLEAEMPENEIEHINNWFEKKQWVHERFKNYVKEIALLVYEDYRTNRKSYLTLRQKIKFWWRKHF